MVYSEMPTTMPINGFGSPVSPPDRFLECREVPSPSQYSDPSSTPPYMHSPAHSMHSPAHYSNELAESFDKLLKQEPRSPYSSSSLLSTGTAAPHQRQQLGLQQQTTSSMRDQCHQQIQQQQFQLQQQQYHQRPGQNDQTQLQQQESVLFGGQTTVHQQQQRQYQCDAAVMSQSDYELAQILNPSNVGESMDPLMLQDDIMNYHGDNSDMAKQFALHPQQPMRLQQHFGVATSQQQLNYINNNSNISNSGSNHHQHQQQSQQLHQLPNSEVFSALSVGPQALVAPGISDPLESSPSAAVPTTSPSPELSSSAAVDLLTNSNVTNANFASLIEASEIKTENTTAPENIDAACFLDTIMEGIMDNAKVSQSPRQWSANDVCTWLKMSAELFCVPLSAMIAEMNIDGATLLRMRPAQVSELVGSKEIYSLVELLCQWLSRREEKEFKSSIIGQAIEVPEQIMQVKLETTLQKHEVKQVKQEVTTHPMLPAPVVNHNQSQDELQSQHHSNQQLSHYKTAVNQCPVEMKSTHNQMLLNNNQQEQPKQHLRTYQQQQPQQHLHQTIKVEHLAQQSPNTSSSPPPHFQMNQNVQQFNQQPSFQLQTGQQLHHQNMNSHSASSVANLSPPPMLQSVSPRPTPTPSPTNSVISGSPLDNNQMLMQHNIMPSPISNPVSLQEGANGYIDDSGTDLSVLLQQATHHHPATLDQDDSMDTDDDAEDSPPAVVSGGTGGRAHIQLWQFLKELLENNKKYGTCIRWLDRQEAIFKIEDSVKVATLWGERKNRPQMNYDKLSRSIRQYYNKQIMKKTQRSQRLVYQFCHPYGQ